MTHDGRHWFAIWTSSHCEQIVHEQLIAKGFESFLPTIRTWSRRAGNQRLIAVPMFPGYLFVHHVMDKTGCIEVLKTRGVVRILGERWDRLAAVPETEIAALQRIASSEVPVMSHPYLREGHRVRIASGALKGLEGLLVQVKANRGLLVVSVDLLQRSVAVELDCTQVVPAGGGRPTPCPQPAMLGA